MKTDNSKHDENGQLKNGLVKEYFKDGSMSCEGEFINGEKQENGNTICLMDN